MKEKEISWDDIPSIEGLGVDWNFEPDNPLGNRAYERLTIKDLNILFQTKKFPVRLVTEKRETRALLVDISQGGVSLHVKDANWEKKQLVKLGFFLGRQKIISKGRIRNVREEQGRVLLGIEFVGLPEEKHGFLSSLYSSIKIPK